MSKTKKRKPLSTPKKLAFMATTLIVILGSAEIAFRIRETVRKNRRVTLSPREPDSYRGKVLMPGRFEIPGHVSEVNSLSMRESSEIGPKKKGTLRILAVGGSTTYGLFTTANDKTWPKRVQAHLQKEGKTVEVLNGGVPAWDLRTSQTNLELRLYALEPDVVICYHAYNDLVANPDPRYAEDSKKDDPSDMWRPLRGSALYRFLRMRLQDPGDALIKKADAITDAGAEAFERNLRRFVKRTRAIGAKPFLCTYPSAFRKTHKESAEAKVPGLKRWFDEMSPFTYPALIGGLARYNDLIRKVAKEETVPYAELEQGMPKDVKLYMSTVHHSDEGEDKVAGIITKALLDSGILDAK